jgi:hypothetical protein
MMNEKWGPSPKKQYGIMVKWNKIKLLFGKIWRRIKR